MSAGVSEFLRKAEPEERQHQGVCPSNETEIQEVSPSLSYEIEEENTEAYIYYLMHNPLTSTLHDFYLCKLASQKRTGFSQQSTNYWPHQLPLLQNKVLLDFLDTGCQQ